MHDFFHLPHYARPAEIGERNWPSAMLHQHQQQQQHSILPGLQDVVRLDVGGTVFKTTHRTLTSHPQSRLAMMLMAYPRPDMVPGEWCPELGTCGFLAL